MKRLSIGAIFAGAVLGASACAEDPTASLRGGPRSLSVSPRVLFISENATASLLVIPRDEELNPVALSVTAASANQAVATVEADAARPSPDTSFSAFTVTAVAPGRTTINLTAGSLTGAATVNVLPLAFGGAISKLTPAGGETITINATPVLKFDPATVAVGFGPDAIPGAIQSATADALQVVVPYFSGGGPLTIDGIEVTYVPGLAVTLPSADDVAQTGDFWTGDEAYTTAPTLTLPASGATGEMITTFGADNFAMCAETAPNFDFGSTGPCVIYQFTVSATTTLTFTADWDSDADLDIYACSAPDPLSCFEEGFGGATTAQPQTFTFDFPAGTHYFVVENYDGVSTDNIYVTISQP